MYGYAYYKISHDELYRMDVQILGDMFKAVIDKDERKADMNMQMLSWQTALLMNATGNYKNPIKPVDLYTPITDLKEKEQISVDDIEKQRRVKQEELLKSFGLEITPNKGSSTGN